MLVSIHEGNYMFMSIGLLAFIEDFIGRRTTLNHLKCFEVGCFVLRSTKYHQTY